MDDRAIFAFLESATMAGGQAVLVTLVSALGSSMRAPGAHMAVAAGGTYCGSLSGGCIERAVVAEALEVLAEGSPRVTRFGQGSRYIDIRLPCGGGVDLHFQPLVDDSLARHALAAIDARRPFSIELSATGSPPGFIEGWHATHWDLERGTAMGGHWPPPRLLLAGHGAAVEHLARQARQWGAQIAVATPDEALAERLRAEGFDAERLTSPRDAGKLSSDPWTAIVFLFHDHDWEPALIAHALSQPNFFIGAMGSRRAHQLRCEALRALDVDEAAIASIKGPIGLFHSVRDPATLALSVLAEVAERHRTHDFAAATADMAAASTMRQTG